MANRDLTEILDTEGPAAPPRPNGELLFESPWEARVFGITMSLYEAGLFEWEEEWNYYECWAAAFERLLASKELCAAGELRKRVEAFEARPHGHDH